MKYFFPVILCFAMMMTSCSELDPQTGKKRSTQKHNRLWERLQKKPNP